MGNGITTGGEAITVIIIEDIGNKAEKHTMKHLYFESHGIYWERQPLPVGDYILANDAVLDVIARKQKRGVAIKKLDFLGSYKVSVDTKCEMQEIIGNVCGDQHERFRDECILAQNNGIKLYVLIQNEDGISEISDLETWENPRAYIKKWVTTPSKERRKVLKYPRATKGTTLAKVMRTMEEKYGCKFLFCTPEEQGKKVVELLNMEADYGK